MKIRAHPVYGYPRPRGFGATVANSGTFGGVVTPATRLQQAVDALNNGGGSDPATAQATLASVLANNYCTPQNPSPECSNPAAAAALIQQMVASVKPSSSGPSTPGQFGYQGPSGVTQYTPIASEKVGQYPNWTPPVTTPRSPGASVNPTPAANYVYAGAGPAPPPTVSAPSGAPAPAASPSWFTDPAQALFGGIPNWMLLAGVAGGAFFFLGGKK